MPQSISTSYGDDEQTGELTTICLRFQLSQCCISTRELRTARLRQLRTARYVGMAFSMDSRTKSPNDGTGARGVSLMFSSGDGGVGDGEEDPALQECFTNDGRNVTQFIPAFPAGCPL